MSGFPLHRSLPLLLSMLLFALGAGAATPPARGGLKSGVFEPARMAPDFSLRGSDGSELKLSRFRGKLVVLEFGYTFCPDVCPVSLAMLADARKKLGAQASEFQVIYVTVDPERDTAEHMRKYLAAFDPTFIGATGTPAQLEKVRKDYGISATKKMVDGSKTAYTVHHSSYLYFVDSKGSLRGLMPFGRTADDIVHDARILLKN